MADDNTNHVLTLPENSLVWNGFLGPTKVFPHTIHIGSATIRLEADGTWSGDAAAFHEEVSKMTSWGQGDFALIIWLVANALRSSKGTEAAAVE